MVNIFVFVGSVASYEVLHSLAPALTLTLSLTHSLNHLANKRLVHRTVQCINATNYEYLIRCAVDYKYFIR